MYSLPDSMGFIAFNVSCRQRCTYVDCLKVSHVLSSKAMMYNYASGNRAGILHFIWKIPEDVSEEALADLRQHNPGRPPKYDAFWEECRKYLEEKVETPVDERRHGEVVHLAKALSARDLLDQVAKQCPPGTPIPCKQWLRLQFCPKNPSIKISVHCIKQEG